MWGGGGVGGREGEYLACSRPHLEPATMCGPRASLDGPSGPWTPSWYSSHPSAPSLVFLPSCQPLLLDYHWMRLNPQISKLSLLTVGLWELTKQHTCCVWSLGQVLPCTVGVTPAQLGARLSPFSVPSLQTQGLPVCIGLGNPSPPT